MSLRIYTVDLHSAYQWTAIDNTCRNRANSARILHERKEGNVFACRLPKMCNMPQFRFAGLRNAAARCSARQFYSSRSSFLAAAQHRMTWRLNFPPCIYTSSLPGTAGPRAAAAAAVALCDTKRNQPTVERQADVTHWRRKARPSHEACCVDNTNA